MAWRFSLLLVPVFLSGAAALTYQVVWLRQLALVFGVTAYAASTVLAAFMGGLALGSLLAGRVAPWLRRPLVAFAAAELLIALSVLLSPWLLDLLRPTFATLQGASTGNRTLLTLIRFLGTFVVLIVPTSMMGATLPLLAASAPVRSGRAAARLSVVYAVNTAGAIVGAWMTGFHLVGAIGMRQSLLLAAASNLAAAVGAFLIALGTRAVAVPASAPAPASGPAAAPPTPDAVRRAVLVAFALSGAAALALEVIWFRVLVLFIPATIYAFSLMLAMVLLGISLGSWIAARLLRRERDWVRLLTTTLLSTAIAAVACVAAQAWSFAAGWRTGAQLQASALTILPTAVLMGVSFPIGLRLWARIDPPGSGGAAATSMATDVGVLYSVNVLGAIAGAIAGGFLLLPLLGSRWSVIACATIYAAAALAVARSHPACSVLTPRVAMLLVLLIGAAAVLPDPMAAAVDRRHGDGTRIVWREEGIQTTVSVVQSPDGHQALYLDGLHQASDIDSILMVHRQIGHLPMVLHGAVRDALVVGLGGGATAGAVSLHRQAAVDVVELSDSVRKGAAFFGHINYDVLARPNVRLRVDDGRNYLLTTARQYDVITADLIQPMHAGSGVLYSSEYFRLARQALRDDGLMLQWVGHRSPIQYGLIVRTFMEVFPETTLWAGGTLMVGSKRPIVVRRAAFDAARQDPALRAALDGIGLTSVDDLLGWYVAGPDALRAFIGPGPVLTDDHPRLEYHGSLPPERGDIDLSTLRGDRRRLQVVN